MTARRTSAPRQDTASVVPHHTVVVIGAGPTGMTAAALLGSYGIDTIVLERWDDVYPQPRAVHLDDEVYRILGSIGLADEFAEISRPGRGLRLVDYSLNALAEFDRDPTRQRHGYPQANMFDQPELERIMRGRLKAFDCVSIRGATEVLDVVNTHDGARVVFTDRDGTGERQVMTAEFVLACDGANSIVRSTIGSSMNDLGFEQQWLVVDVSTDTDLDQWDGVHQVCDNDRAATYMRIGPTRYRWEFRLRDGESADRFDTIDRVHPLIAPWLSGQTPPDLTLVRSTEYTFRAQVANRWRDRRVFLLGDSAHLTPPFIGQGMGAGLRDAANLVWKLAGVVSGSFPEDVLDTYEQERAPHVTSMIRLAVAIGWAMTGGGATADICRRRLAGLVVHVPGLGTKVTDSTTPVLARSAFVRRRRVPLRDLAGSLCPNVLLENGQRLDAVAPGRFLVVTCTTPTAGQRREIERRGATIVTVPDSSELGEWLRSGRTTTAIVRPDHTVMETGNSVPALHTRVPTLVAPSTSA